MGKVSIVVVFSALAGLCFVQPVVAGPLPTDPAAIAGWQGTQAFQASIAVATLQASVDYAVYAPGDFSNSAALGNPADPSGGTQYVYAYQVLVDRNGNRPLEQLSVGFADVPPLGNGVDDLEDPQNIGFVNGWANPDVDPTASFAPDNNPATIKEAANWAFPSGLSPTDSSDILIYTSAYGPEWDAGSVIGSGLGDSQRLPSPVPEPATLGLLLLGGTCLFVRLCARRRRSRP